MRAMVTGVNQSSVERSSSKRTSPKNTTVWNIEAARTRSRQVVTKPHSAGNNEETANPIALRQ